MRGAPGRHRSAVTWWTLLLSFVVVSGRGEAPLAEAMKENPDLVKYWNPVREYLTRYGYLSSSPSAAADNLRTEEQLRMSIREMQKFGGVPPTGRVDAPTLQLLRKRRCGIPDIVGGAQRARRYAIQGQKWSRKDLTWSVKYWPPSLSAPAVRSELSKALKVWSDVSLLNFQETRRGDADIVVSFERGKHGDGYAFDGRGVVLAHAFFPGEGIGGDAHFDAEEPWVSGPPPVGTDGVSLFAVAVHEFGHSLGLSHSTVSGSLMNPFYQTIKDNFQLPHDDTIGIQRLYGSKNQTRWAPMPPYNPGPPVKTTTKKPKHGSTGATYAPVEPKRPIPEPHPKKPHTCNTTFDAISVIRGEVFIFKSKYFWRLNSKGLMEGYPAEISRFFYDSDLKVIDAVYERSVDTKIVFFSGKKYWLFNANTKERGYPRPLTDLGLPPDLDRIDAAMVWGYNGKTYLFSGTQYWRYDETEGRVELDYPRDMAMWRGVPYNIDAAFQNTDGITYFFKGKRFWEFNDFQMKVRNKSRNSNEYWFGCPSHNEMSPESEGITDENGEESAPGDSTSLDKDTNQFLLASFVATFLILTLRKFPYL